MVIGVPYITLIDKGSSRYTTGLAKFSFSRQGRLPLVLVRNQKNYYLPTRILKSGKNLLIEIIFVSMQLIKRLVHID